MPTHRTVAPRSQLPASAPRRAGMPANPCRLDHQGLRHVLLGLAVIGPEAEPRPAATERLLSALVKSGGLPASSHIQLLGHWLRGEMLRSITEEESRARLTEWVEGGQATFGRPGPAPKVPANCKSLNLAVLPILVSTPPRLCGRGLAAGGRPSAEILMHWSDEATQLLGEDWIAICIGTLTHTLDEALGSFDSMAITASLSEAVQRCGLKDLSIHYSAGPQAFEASLVSQRGEVVEHVGILHSATTMRPYEFSSALESIGLEIHPHSDPRRLPRPRLSA